MRPILLFIAFLSISVYSQDNPQWMRHSSISPDGTQIAFTNMPGKIDNGIDEQLLRSIQEFLKDVN